MYGMGGFAEGPADALRLVEALSLPVVAAGLVAGRTLCEQNCSTRLHLAELLTDVGRVVCRADRAPFVDKGGMQGVVYEDAPHLLVHVAHRHHADQRVSRAAGNTAVSADAGLCAAYSRAGGKLRLKRVLLAGYNQFDQPGFQFLHVFLRLRDARFEAFDVQPPGSPGSGMGVDGADHDVLRRDARCLLHPRPDTLNVDLGEEQQIERYDCNFCFSIAEIQTARVERVMRACVVSGIMRIAAELQPLRRGDVDNTAACFHHILPPVVIRRTLRSA